MKVKIELTVDIDVDAWMLNYGVERNEVNADVKNYCAGVLLDWLGPDHIDVIEPTTN